MAGQPKAPFWLVVWVVILALVGLAAWRAGVLEQFGLGRPGGGVAPVVAGGAGTGGTGASGTTGAEGILFEAADSGAPTTVKEYSF